MSEAHPYSLEEVQAILAEALSLQARDRFTRAQLFEMAAEMNVSPELIEQVEQDWRQRQQQKAQEQARRSRQRKQFQQELITYVAVNGGLILLNLATAGTVTWAIFPLLGWGFGLVLGGHKSGVCASNCSSPGAWHQSKL